LPISGTNGTVAVFVQQLPKPPTQVNTLVANLIGSICWYGYQFTALQGQPCLFDGYPQGFLAAILFDEDNPEPFR
jgi:hypothetical protein